MKIKASLSITCSNHGKFSIAITDETSGIEFVELTLTPEQMALALATRYMTGLDAEVRSPDRIGWTHEHKLADVPFDCYHGSEKNRAEEAQLALAPFEVDGWGGQVSDLFNDHRRTKKDGVWFQAVTFHRHVKPTEEQANE